MKLSFFSFFFSFFLLHSTYSVAQLVNDKHILNYNQYKRSYSLKNPQHTSFKPSFNNYDSLEQGRRFSFFSLSKNNLSLQINPAFDLSFGLQNKSENTIYRHSVGSDVKAKIKKWSFGFTYLRNMGKYMHYQSNFILENRTVPGLNVSKGRSFYQADFFSSFLNFKANKVWDFEIGYGRNFIGDGYRSLLLSDYANASPYLKITTKFWKIQYTNLFSSHQNIYSVAGSPSLYKRKYSASHYLSWIARPWLNISLFETIVWQAKEAQYTRGFDVNYLNPFIFYRPVEFSTGSSDNVLVGANIKVTPFKNHVFYAQFLFDEFLLDELRADFNQFRNPNKDIRSGWWANKYGIQIGWNSFDLFNIPGLQTRVEYNLVRPYTYAHSSPTQAYSNYNLSLAHPLGANFHEFIAIFNYQKKKWLVKAQFNQSRRGASPLGENFGENILLSNSSRSREYENHLSQGVPVFTHYFDASLGYVVDKSIGAIFSVGIVWREQKVEKLATVNSSVFVSLKTNLFNQYWDH